MPARQTVQADLPLLETYGLVKLTAGCGVRKRWVNVPEDRFGAIVLTIAL